MTAEGTSEVDRLHPAIVHHAVNTLGWKALRPLQEAAINPILDGSHALLVAPTAGGKTEAAVLPVLSRMLEGNWRGLSVLYLCPIKALLNNLHTRLEHYTGLIGRRAELWHGDVGATNRLSIRSDPPDLLLTTPESLELMLVSNGIDHRQLLGSVRVVIVDEIHAFAGDDRGWHLLALLERLGRLTAGPVQRLGLSATVGNPNEILTWLVGGASGSAEVVRPEVKSDEAVPELALDHVGTLDNAAQVIASLHRGEKRLVFVDSRAAVEQIGARLRELGVTTFVSHSSLSIDTRRQAESAFAEGTNCVIVATSTLELGIDVGDLDRVIQVDSPGRVASALQRMGRTGRRVGSLRNYLILATGSGKLLESAALLHLMRSGYIEPVEPPPHPLHVFAQQVMALTLQERGIGRALWPDWIGAMPGFAGLAESSTRPTERADQIIDWMVERGVLVDDQGMLSIGEHGEQRWGWKHFSELLSVFTSMPLFTLLHGRQEIGQIDPASFQLRQGTGAIVVLMAGRSWSVGYIDWKRRVAFVEPIEMDAKSRWRGAGRALSFELCQAMRTVLSGVDPDVELSERAQRGLASLRSDAPPLDGDHLVVTRQDDRSTLWTFAGERANATLSIMLEPLSRDRSSYDDTTVTFDPGHSAAEVLGVLRGGNIEAALSSTPVAREALDSLKFSECLPPETAEQVLRERLIDPDAVTTIVAQPVRLVVGN